MTTEKVTVANLDANRVYWGLLEIDKADLTPEHVVLPECDLPPGKYHWDPEHRHFKALLVAADSPARPALERVVYELVRHAVAQGATAPELQDFLRYERPIDDMPNIDGVPS